MESNQAISCVCFKPYSLLLYRAKIVVVIGFHIKFLIYTVYGFNQGAYDYSMFSLK